MSSRILQEDTSLLLTEANEPIVNDNYISADGFYSGSPTLQTTSLVQNHILNGSSVTTDTTVIGNVNLTQKHSITANTIATDVPTVATTAISEKNILVADNIIAASPVVPSVGIVEDEKSAIRNVITGSPLIGSSAITQNHSLSGSSITTGLPRLGTADDPNYILQQEIREIEQMFGGWPRRNYEVPDGRLVQAEREIERTFGEKVSIDRKAKSLIKFGKSAPLSTSGLQTVWTVGGNETYVSDNIIDSISSSSALDQQEVYIEGHTVSGVGTNQKFTFVTQVVTLNGQNRVALTTPLARVSQAYNNNGTSLVGRVCIDENTAITAGIPDDATKIHIDIQQGLQQAFKAATTFSDNDYYILTGGFGSVSIKQAGAADFYLEIKEAGKVFRQVAAVSASSGSPWEIDLDPAVIIPKNCDVRVRVETSTNNVIVFTVFKGYLAKVL